VLVAVGKFLEHVDLYYINLGQSLIFGIMLFLTSFSDINNVRLRSL